MCDAAVATDNDKGPIFGGVPNSACGSIVTARLPCRLWRWKSLYGMLHARHIAVAAELSADVAPPQRQYRTAEQALLGAAV